MSIEFEIYDLIPAAPSDVYHAWLDSDLHSQMTGGLAEVSAEVGGLFSAWDGYINGRNLRLIPGRMIVQAWRTADFSEGEMDSQLEIEFKQEDDNTRVTIRHTELPPHGMQYKQGWIDAYFNPMKKYFDPR